MVDILYALQKLVDKLKQTNSTNEKKNILANCPECKDILFYIYHPFKQFNVTSKNLKKLKNINVDYIAFDNIFELLDSISNRNITGHRAIKSVNMFIENNKEYEDLIYNIIDKNLKCRINTSLINKVWKDFIPEFDLALAYSYEDYSHKVDFENQSWYASHKLNGVRCIVIKEGNSVKYISRSGKEFFTLDTLTPYILKIPKENFVLDGELCILDPDGKENFKSIVSEVRKKNHTIKNPKYILFDILEVSDFNRKKSKEKLSERLSMLNRLIPKGIKQYISIVDQTKIKNNDHFEELQKEMIESGWEGLIIRKDIPYEGKRSRYMLKVKLFQEDEFIVKDVEFGPIRHIIYEGDDKIPKEIESLMLTRAVVDYNGYELGIGSGWSIDERIKYCNNPELLIGKQITVKYFAPSTNKQGGESLTWATVKHVWDKKRDI